MTLGLKAGISVTAELCPLVVSVCLAVSVMLPESPAFVGQRETLLPRHEVFIALLGKIKEEGGILIRITAVERLLLSPQPDLTWHRC